MMVDAPRVSVLLPVYNGGPYLRAAVDSVLAQTFADFELIAIDDGSTDGSGAVLDAIRDPRLRVVHQENAGLALTLNRAIALSRGEYLARQDADDLCLPERFARQVAYLDAHPHCALLGTWSRIWEGERATARGHRHPRENGELQLRGLFDSFFVHSSVMMRRAALEAVGPYPTDPQRFPPEDFDLWSRIARRFEVANLPEVLQIYREVPVSISRTRAELLLERAMDIAIENLEFVLGGKFALPVLRDLAALGRRAYELVSPQPEWAALERALAALRRHFLGRFPGERAAIARGERAVRHAFRRTRLRRALGDGPLWRALRGFRHILPPR